MGEHQIINTYAGQAFQVLSLNGLILGLVLSFMRDLIQKEFIIFFVFTSFLIFNFISSLTAGMFVLGIALSYSNKTKGIETKNVNVAYQFRRLYIIMLIFLVLEFETLSFLLFVQLINKSIS